MLRDRDTNEIVRVSRNAIAWRGKDDNVHHLARIVPDQDLERANMQVYALDPHPELQRLHALAHQLQESPYGITYGTREVNVGLQEPLERFIAKIAKDSASDSVNTYLHTVTATKPNTMMLRSQDYNVFKGTTTDGKVSLTHLFTASLDSERSHDGPKCVIKVANSEFAERLPKELKRHLIE